MHDLQEFTPILENQKIYCNARKQFIGGSKGVDTKGTSQGPLSFLFMQFSANVLPNNRLAYPH